MKGFHLLHQTSSFPRFILARRDVGDTRSHPVFGHPAGHGNPRHGVTDAAHRLRIELPTHGRFPSQARDSPKWVDYGMLPQQVFGGNACLGSAPCLGP